MGPLSRERSERISPSTLTFPSTVNEITFDFSKQNNGSGIDQRATTEQFDNDNRTGLPSVNERFSQEFEKGVI